MVDFSLSNSKNRLQAKHSNMRRDYFRIPPILIKLLGPVRHDDEHTILFLDNYAPYQSSDPTVSNPSIQQPRTIHQVPCLRYCLKA